MSWRVQGNLPSLSSVTAHLCKALINFFICQVIVIVARRLIVPCCASSCLALPYWVSMCHALPHCATMYFALTHCASLSASVYLLMPRSALLCFDVPRRDPLCLDVSPRASLCFDVPRHDSLCRNVLWCDSSCLTLPHCAWTLSVCKWEQCKTDVINVCESVSPAETTYSPQITLQKTCHRMINALPLRHNGLEMGFKITQYLHIFLFFVNPVHFCVCFLFVLNTKQRINLLLSLFIFKS